MKKKIIRKAANNGTNHHANDYYPLHFSIVKTKLKRKNTRD